MKLMSEFIKECESLKEQYGDLPIVTMNNDTGTFLHNDDTEIEYNGVGVKDLVNNCHVPCFMIGTCQ